MTTSSIFDLPLKPAGGERLTALPYPQLILHFVLLVASLAVLH